MAVRDVVAGLLAPGALQTQRRAAIADGEDPIFCPRGGGERGDLRGAEAGRLRVSG